MRIAEGHRAHIAHIQFHSYGDPRGKSSQNPTSKAREIAEYVNTHPNISADVGQVMFGKSTSMTADAPLAYMISRLGGGKKWVNADTEHESGCGIVPFTYQDRVYTHALQWAIGLELFLLAKDPWRMVFSTDHPNGGSFMSYPRLIRLLMDREYRKQEMAQVNQKALDHTGLRDLDREYTLNEIAIITRAGPARLLGLARKGHLGVGADADITIYEADDDKEKMFAAPRYVIKDGELVIEDHEFRVDHEGRLLHVAPDFDPAIEQVIEPFFEDFYTIRFANYAVDDRYAPHHEVIPTAPQAAGSRT
jgi:formylmethanofuran dehydrogenase subunit A